MKNSNEVFVEMNELSLSKLGKFVSELDANKIEEFFNLTFKEIGNTFIAEKFPLSGFFMHLYGQPEKISMCFKLLKGYIENIHYENSFSFIEDIIGFLRLLPEKEKVDFFSEIESKIIKNIKVPTQILHIAESLGLKQKREFLEHIRDEIIDEKIDINVIKNGEYVYQKFGGDNYPLIKEILFDNEEIKRLLSRDNRVAPIKGASFPSSSESFLNQIDANVIAHFAAVLGGMAVAIALTCLFVPMAGIFVGACIGIPAGTATGVGISAAMSLIGFFSAGDKPQVEEMEDTPVSSIGNKA